MVTAIILAGGTGSRMNSDTKKQFIKINDKMIIEHTIDRFANNNDIDRIVVVGEQVAQYSNYKKIVKVVDGGDTRQQSSLIGLSCVDYNDGDIVLIHDGARPNVSQRIITECVEMVRTGNNCVTAVQVTDTILQANTDKYVQTVPNREQFYQAQTPQAFIYKDIIEAHKQNITCTDDSGLLIAQGKKVKIVVGDKTNIKITTNEDLKLAELYLK